MDNNKELDSLARAYQSVFSGPNGEKVLEDLAHYCGEHKDLFSSDPLAMAHNTGVRKVFLRILGFTKLNRDQIWNLNNASRTTSSDDSDEYITDDYWPSP